jgi:hypothetical protein
LDFGTHKKNPNKRKKKADIHTFSPTHMKYKDLARWASCSSFSPKFSSASAILHKQEEKLTKRIY